MGGALYCRGRRHQTRVRLLLFSQILRINDDGHNWKQPNPLSLSSTTTQSLPYHYYRPFIQLNLDILVNHAWHMKSSVRFFFLMEVYWTFRQKLFRWSLKSLVCMYVFVVKSNLYMIQWGCEGGKKKDPNRAKICNLGAVADICIAKKYKEILIACNKSMRYLSHNSLLT